MADNNTSDSRATTGSPPHPETDDSARATPTSETPVEETGADAVEGSAEAGPEAPEDPSAEEAVGEQATDPSNGTGVFLRWEPEEEALYADFDPEYAQAALDSDTLKSLITQAGYAEVCLFREVVSQLIRQQRDSRQTFSLHIGGHRDARVDITVDPKGHHAEARLLHPCGNGRTIDEALLREALSEAGVTHGIRESEFPRIIKDQGRTLTDPILIAQGTQPTHGEDSHFVSLIPDAVERKPRMLDEDIVDYRDFGGIITVHEGDELVRRTPPTEGTDGHTVTGETIPAQPGKTRDFKLDKTVQLKEDDPDVLVAAISGMPVITDQGAKVEQTVELDNIDLNVGHVDFDGTITVKGDIIAGMRVTATGDINVGGTVEAATLRADGNITVNGGILGHGNVRDEQGELRRESGMITSGCTVTARFIKNILVEAQDSVVARDLINNSEVTAYNQVLVGGKGGPAKAQIVGGMVRATAKIESAIIGSPRATHTRVEVGYDPEFHNRYKAARQAIIEKQQMLADVERMVNFYRGSPEKARAAEKAKPGVLQKLVKTQRQARADLAQLQANLDALEEDLEHIRKARVVAKRQVYSNVTIIFGPKSRTTDEDLEGGSFALHDQWITFRKGKT